MIFSNITVPLLGWSIRRLLVILIVRFIWAAWRWCNGDQLSLYAVAVFAHEHTGLTAQAYGAKNPQALARALCNRCCWRWGPGR